MLMQDLVQKIKIEYNIDVDKFLELYKQGYSRKEIAEILETTEWNVRQVSTLLGLRMKKRYRVADYEYLITQLKNENGDISLIDEFKKDIEILNEELLKKNKALIKCRDEKRILNKQIRDITKNEVNFNKFLKLIKEEINNVEWEVKYGINVPIKSKDGLTLICLSDLHLGNLVKSELVGNLNEFNFEIAFNRIKKVFLEALEYENKYLKVVILGDILQGIIHDSKENAEFPVVKVLVEFVNKFSSLLLNIYTEFDEVEIILTNSNHSRLTQEISFNNKSYDFDYLIYEMLKQTLKPFKINVKYDLSGYNLIDLKNGKFALAFHGDTIRNYNPSNTNSLLQIIQLSKQMFNVEPYLVLSGHTHKYMSALLPNGGKAITCGSLIGMDNYAFNSGFIPEKPSQIILNIDKKGKIEEKLVVFDN